MAPLFTAGTQGGQWGCPEENWVLAVQPKEAEKGGTESWLRKSIRSSWALSGCNEDIGQTHTFLPLIRTVL